MRVTNNYIFNKFARSISNSNSKMVKLNAQVSSGNKISKASENPNIAMKSMKVRRDLSRIEQYQSNLESAQGWFDESETLITNIKKLADEAKLSVMQGINGTYGEVDRKALAQSLRILRDQILAIGNTCYSGKQILGGPNATKAPFTVVNGKMYYNGSDMETLSAESCEDIFTDMGMGLTIDNNNKVLPQTALSLSLNAQKIMGVGVDSTTGYSNNIYNLLGQLADKFDSNDLTGIQVGMDKISGLCDQLTVQMVSAGEKSEFVEFLISRYETEHFNAEKKQTTIESVDLSRAIIDAKSAEVAYNAIIQIGAKIIQPSLIDYLK